MIYIVMMAGLCMLTVYSVYLALEQLVKKPEADSGKEKTMEEILEEVVRLSHIDTHKISVRSQKFYVNVL